VDHDDDVCAGGESFAIAGLLVATIAVVVVVHKGLHAEPSGKLRGLVFGGVVNEDFDVYDIGQFANGFLEGFLGVIGRHDDRNPFSVDHDLGS